MSASTTTAVRPLTASWPAWLRAPVGIADLLFVIFALGLMQRAQGSMLDDPGIGWHLRNIDAMWSAGGWLTTDPFTLPTREWPWRTNVWLGDLTLWLGWQWGGLEGVAAVAVVVLALTFRLLYSLLIRDGVPWPIAAGWTFVGALGTSLSWTARPNVFTLLGVMVTAWVCDRFHRGLCSRRQTFWLLPMFIVWVNAHGGFLAGMIVLGVTLVVEGALALGIPHAKDRPAALARAKHLGLLLGLSFLATLVNPYGFELYTWTARLLSNDLFMNLNTEWKSPDFHLAGAMRFEFLMLLLPAVIALSKRRPSLVALAICLAFLHLALSGQRYVALWVVVTVPMLARLSVDIPLVQRAIEYVKGMFDAGNTGTPAPKSVGTNTPGTNTVGGESLRRRKQNTVPVGEGIRLPQLHTKPPSSDESHYTLPRGTVTAVAALLLLFGSRWASGYASHSPEHIPVAALNATLERSDGAPIFHHYNWGGWLVWHGWPRVHSFIDDRNEVHGADHIDEYFTIIDAREGWRERFDRYGFRLVCIPPSSSLARELSRMIEWKVVYRDEFAVVFEKVGGG